MLTPSEPLVRKTQKQAVWDLGSDLICQLARLRIRRKDKIYKTELAARATEILEFAGYMLDEEGRVVGTKGEE